METVSFGNGWEGRVVGGRFPLLEWLGGSENCGSFFTVLQGLQEAVIHLILAGGAEAVAYIGQWDVAMALSHPHLVKVLAAGRSVIDRRDLVYVVTERSYSNLAKIVQSRALKADSARETFAPVLNAISYLHENGVVHGHINLLNIQFADMKPKLSVTDLLIAGSIKRAIQTPGNYDAPELTDGVVTAAADTWSLGMTLLEAMTQAAPSWDHSRSEEPELAETLPGPFREIVQDCLRLDPLHRCTIQSIVERLEGSKSIPHIEGPIPVKIESPPRAPQIREQRSGNRDQRREIDESLRAETPNPASKIPMPTEPEALPHSAKEKIGIAESSEPVLFSRPLTHFEDGTTSRFRIIPLAGVLLAVIAFISVVLVLRHKSEIPRSVESQNAPAISPPVAEKQSEAPAPAATNQTEPESPPVSETQPDGASQTKTQSAPAPEQPVPPPPSPVNQAVDKGETEGLVLRQVIPTVSPGARTGMRGPVTVLIRVSVSPDGGVSDAAYMSQGPGNYFARLAQRAARSWKFKPPTRNGEAERSVWTLRFDFERQKTQATATEDTN